MTTNNSSKPSLSEREHLRQLYERYRPTYEKNLMRLQKYIRKLLLQTDINFNIKYRLKSFDSFFQKLIRYRQKGIEPVMINDLIGLRIICPFLEDVERVERLLRDNFTVLEVEHKHAHKAVTEFSYEAVHLILEIPAKYFDGFIPYSGRTSEVQLRTILQDAWAEVEHELIYKANFSLLNEPIKRKLASLNATLTLSDIIFQEIRDYQKEIQALREKCHVSMTEKITFPDGKRPESSAKEVAEETLQEIPQGIISRSKIEKQLFDALEAHSRHQYKTAIGIYTQILKQRLKPIIRSIIYNHRGMAYFVMGDYEKALNDFNRALKFDPQNLRSLNNRGSTYRMLKKYDLALQDFQKSIELDGYQHETYHMRALTYFDLMDYPRALNDCNKALSLKPDYEPARALQKIIASHLNF